MGRQLQMSMLKEGEHATAQALVDEGQWLMLSDGTICEPVKECSEEPQAHELRGRLAVWYPAEDFRVVMTADTVPV